MHIQAPKFTWSFFLPKFWLTWVGIFLLYTISWLPYRIQTVIGAGIGRLIFTLLSKRKRIAQRNLELCFPDMTTQERKKILDGHRFSLGMAVLETSMGWWWPKWRVEKHTRIHGYEHVEAILKKGKGVFGLAIHNMTLELGCRSAGFIKPSVAFYRKNNNDLMEYMQYHGRNRSNKYMVHKRDVRSMIKALDDGEVTFYLPDQDYGRNKAEFVPFFNVQDTATTTGTMLFAKEANCESVFIVPVRKNGIYHITFIPGLENFPSGDDKEDVARINRKVEELIMLAPEQYLWVHKRFKTRPNKDDPSLYD